MVVNGRVFTLHTEISAIGIFGALECVTLSFICQNTKQNIWKFA